MKTKINQLVDRLADKTLSFGCMVEWTYRHHQNSKSSSLTTKRGRVVSVGDFYVMDKSVSVILGSNKSTTTIPKNEIVILGHDIKLGDIVKARNEKKVIFGIMNILRYWQACGAEISLQQVIENSGWEEHIEEDAACLPLSWTRHERLKDSSARVLFDILLSTFPDEQ